MTPSLDITQLLSAWRSGDETSANRLIEIVYPVLLASAARQLEANGRVITQQPRDIVQDAYLRLVQQTRTEWRNRAHFYAIASGVIRRVIIDHLRRRSRQKRGGGFVRVPMDDAIRPLEEAVFDWLALDEALSDLEELDPRAARVVELRFFVGCTVPESAAALDVSVSTVEADWRVAKAWLHDRLTAGE